MSLYTPNLTLDQAKALIKQYSGNTVQLFKTIQADLLTPISAYLRVSENSKYSFLLESAAQKESVGRYTIIGAHPSKILITGSQYDLKGDPLIHLETEIKKVEYIKGPDTTIHPASSGAYGYIGYDCVQYFEPKTACDLEDKLEMPDSIFMICNNVVVFDNLFKVVKVFSNLSLPVDYNRDTDEHLIENLYDACIHSIDNYITMLNTDRTPLPEQKKVVLGNTHTSLTGENRFLDMVKFMKEHIVKGDIFQSVPSQLMSRPTSLHPFNLYRFLRTINPSPYMFYFDLGDFQLVGASPELLAKVQNRVLYNHPIAGTAKRGKTAEEDEKIAQELLSDKKERAEHVMLVDLGRNDLNRVCYPETVSVDKVMQVEYFSHVIHITSSISGTLRDDMTCFNAFRSTLPAGTLSGSPKVRAVQLIYEAEKQKRGVYAGAVGHFQYNGDMDTCIAIRTIVFKDDVAYLQAGAGIVYDSVPEKEWAETIAKSMSNIKTIEQAENYYYDLQNKK
ncbi:hypothetical protein BB561_003821 [Smittium simulii]|uniref:anthranilate synthase n=1 Tax=Smittium simulii TaxID=133385 RepID=A0A2T9YJL0_9FUNG|nr:hypothetical protein BB561_003821 [Smittium simulii]